MMIDHPIKLSMLNMSEGHSVIPIIPADKEFTLNKTIRQNTSATTVNSYINIVLVCISVIVVSIIFFRSGSIEAEKRVFIACIGATVGFGVTFILCLARRDPITLLLFTSLCTYLSGIFLGLSICYL